MKKDTVLKKCTAEDLDALRELMIRTFCEAFAHRNTDRDMEAYLKDAFNAARLRGELNNINSEFYFLYRGGKLAGYLKLNEAPSQTDLNDKLSLEIERIYISGEFQGEGLGGYLMNHAVDLSLRKNKRYIWLGVWEKNEKAIRFYKKNGFYKIGEHSFFIGEDQQTDFIMRKDLP